MAPIATDGGDKTPGQVLDAGACEVRDQIDKRIFAESITVLKNPIPKPNPGETSCSEIKAMCIACFRPLPSAIATSSW